MSRKPIALLPGLAKEFMADMRAFFAEPDPIERDEIAARQLRALRPYSPRTMRKLRLSDVHEMFLQMPVRLCIAWGKLVRHYN